MIRILHIANARMGSGGVESFLMNLYRHMDREVIQLDFMVFSEEEGMHEQEIAALGGHIYKVPRKKEGLFKNLNTIRRIVKENNYKIVHRNCDAAIMLLDVLAARAGGAKFVIAHSHSTQNYLGPVHKICKPILKHVVDYRFSCSDAAGRWMYGNAEFKIIPNGIDTKKFEYKDNIREKVRESLYIPDDFLLVGTVGLFKGVKNTSFLIDVFSEVHTRNPRSALLLVGDGELRDNLERQVESLHLKQAVIFIGTRDDVNELLMALDIFVLPSLYEGLPVSLVEAQTSGVYCLLSDKVPSEAILNSEIAEQLPLEAGIKYWADKILAWNGDYDRHNGSMVVRQAGYDIRAVADEMQRFYLSLGKEVLLGEKTNG